MPPGRPTKLTPEMRDRICRLVRVGVSLEVAATAVGVAAATVYRWRHRDQGFMVEVERARPEAEVCLAAQLAGPERSGWQAAAWVLERRWPER